jgi:Ca2+-binding EF-hand superfamily protein
MKSSIWFVSVLSLGLASAAAAQQRANMRFAGMDTNRDGVITRAEWRGNDRAFNNQDWNGDGILSGDEVRPGARRPDTFDDRPVGTSGRGGEWTAVRFRALDRNSDGRIERNEWQISDDLFSRLDRNRDGVVSVTEFTAEANAEGNDRFATLDANSDTRLTRDEWRGSPAVFDALDANRDGALTRREAVGTAGVRDNFRSVDVNGDGIIARNEWHWNAAAFDRLDVNRDNRLSRDEFTTSPAAAAPPTESAAYRAGYDRGRQEGIQAGREDKPRGWDLEGQRELETADSGYQPRFGNRGEYQAGYRTGFRRGYREGFDAQ